MIAGWGHYQFFVFLATTLFINSLVEAFFMPNAEEFSELVRTGGLDFALLKPIDTQFLISLTKVDWSSFANFTLAGVLLWYSLAKLDYTPNLLEVVLYPIYVFCGVAIMYAMMIALAATSVWLGRNQTLYDFWFYITNFARYPMEIYSGQNRPPAAAILYVLNSRDDCGERTGPADGKAHAAGILVSSAVCRSSDDYQHGSIALDVRPLAGSLP